MPPKKVVVLVEESNIKLPKKTMYDCLLEAQFKLKYNMNTLLANLSKSNNKAKIQSKIDEIKSLAKKLYDEQEK